MATSSREPRGAGVPNEVARRLFAAAPDRDERAQQLGMEMLLTISANNYEQPRGAPRSPRRQNLYLRSLAVRHNFLADREERLAIGSRLAHGEDFAGSENLRLVQQSLESLIDAGTLRGGEGTRLMLPVHESLLWYDARSRFDPRSRRPLPYRAQRVLMRGTGITLARFLLSPPEHVKDLAEQAAEACAAIRDALTADSPFAELGRILADPDEEPAAMVAGDEEDLAWTAAEHNSLKDLGRRLIQHAHAVMTDPAHAPQVKLLHLRTVVAIDVAWHLLQAAWEAAGAASEQRYLLFCHAPQPRSENRVRVLSEASYQTAHQVLGRGLIASIRDAMREQASSGGDWDGFFLERNHGKESAAAKYLESLRKDLEADESPDFDAYAGRAFEAPGNGYLRPVDAFRVLLESCGLLAGTGRWRYLRPTPGVLSALMAARPTAAPQEADEVLAWMRAEWAVIIGEQEAAGTRLAGQVEGSALQRNREHFERELVRSGLATALSDQTCMVGMRV